MVSAGVKRDRGVVSEMTRDPKAMPGWRQRDVGTHVSGFCAHEQARRGYVRVRESRVRASEVSNA